MRVKCQMNSIERKRKRKRTEFRIENSIEICQCFHRNFKDNDTKVVMMMILIMRLMPFVRKRNILRLFSCLSKTIYLHHCATCSTFWCKIQWFHKASTQSWLVHRELVSERTNIVHSQFGECKWFILQSTSNEHRICLFGK